MTIFFFYTAIFFFDNGEDNCLISCSEITESIYVELINFEV
jgi:hypothetical protein